MFLGHHEYEREHVVAFPWQHIQYCILMTALYVGQQYKQHIFECLWQQCLTKQ